MNRMHISTLPMPDRDHIRGPIDAPIKLVEYGDYECPYCGEAYPVVKEIQARLGHRLCFAFRNFPLANAHPHAEHAAEAAEAAHDQGCFWERHDLLYENQDALEDVDLARYASDLGLDARRLIGDVQAEAHASRIRARMRDRGTSATRNKARSFNGANRRGRGKQWLVCC